MKLPGKPGSCWTATAPATAFPKLEAASSADVTIVGAGIVGLTAAYLLTQAGLSVIVLEGRRVGWQVTGRSTAKITTQHSLIYRHLIDTFGLDAAKQYADANHAGIEQIRQWVRELRLACDFESKHAYAYCTNQSRVADLQFEAEAARKVGLEAELLDRAPLPFVTTGALRFRNQAQFNPAQYLIGLAKAAEARGTRIFEESRVTHVDTDHDWKIKTGLSSVTAKHVVLATNLPIAGPVRYDQRTQPRSHIAMAFRIAQETSIDGMFIGIDEPTHSLRMGRDQDGLLLVVLGAKFATGHEGDVAQYFLDLENWTRENFQVGAAAWRWVNEDYDTADRVPFAGAEPKAPGLYLGTGFNAWGISNGSAAGILISKQILGEQLDWAPIYNPARKAPKNFNKGGDTRSLVNSLDEIEPGGGAVMNLGREKLRCQKTMMEHLTLCQHLARIKVA